MLLKAVDSSFCSNRVSRHELVGPGQSQATVVSEPWLGSVLARFSFGSVQLRFEMLLKAVDSSFCPVDEDDAKKRSSVDA
uniref:Uncharacterized protein n=1 Tax=Helianthus annuus TaxID=4232 RepID=A0A251VHM4_HELAN